MSLFDKYLKKIVMSGYVIFVGVMLWRHDMWRDEAQLWLLSRNSSSLVDLYQNTKYELRPMGWFLICWVISRFTSNIEALKLVTWCLSSIAAYLVIYQFKLRTYQSLLFLCGFLPLLGYATLSEDYMLGVVILFSYVSIKINNRSTLKTFLLLGLLANVHFLFLLVAGPLLIAETISGVKQQKFSGKGRESQRFIGAVLVSYSLSAIALAMIWPSEDNRWRPKPIFDPYENAVRAVTSLNHTMFPFIDSKYLQQTQPYAWKFLSMVTLLIILAIMRHSWRVHRGTALVALCATSLLTLNMTFGYGYFWWHFGILLICLFSLLVLTEEMNASSSGRAKTGRLSLLLILLVPQVFASFTLPGTHFLTDRPYSNGKSTAKFIQKECKSDCVVVVAYEMYGAPISAYLGGREVFYVDKQRFGSFSAWGEGATTPVNWDTMINSLRKFKKSVLVTSVTEDAPQGVLRLARFQGAIWSDEDYDIYQLSG